MKRRIAAVLLALCMCIGLLPATALAADAITENDFVKFEYETPPNSDIAGVGAGTVTVIVRDTEDNQLGTLTAVDYYKTVPYENTITLRTSEYELVSVDVSHGTKVDLSKTSTESKFSWTFIPWETSTLTNSYSLVFSVIVFSYGTVL